MNIGKIIGQGRTAEIFEYSDGKILKLFRDGFPERAVEFEYNVSSELVRQGLPTARVYELVEHDNRLGIIYERIYGIPMMRYISSKPWSISKQAIRFAEIHFNMQKSVDYDLPDSKDRLIENICRTDLIDDDIKDTLKKYVESLPDGNILCHGDFHPDNILVSKDKSYIIDWMTATKGDPLFDVARTMLLFKFAVLPDEKPHLEKAVINFFRRVFLKSYIKHYIKLSGVSIKEIEKWELPAAAARLIEWIPKDEKDILISYIKDKVYMQNKCI